MPPATAGRYGVAVGIDPPTTPVPPTPSEGVTFGTFHPVLAFEVIQELNETHLEALPVLSLLMLPRVPAAVEAAHLQLQHHMPPDAGAIQVPPHTPSPFLEAPDNSKQSL